MLQWIDEEAAIFAICQLETPNIVTKMISEINFVSPCRMGDIVEIGVGDISFGKTSISFFCEVRNKTTKQPIVKIDKIVFVCVDENGKSTPHGKENPTM